MSAEVNFLSAYYADFLRGAERHDLARLGVGELTAVAADASALRKCLVDLIDEGYADLAEPVIRATDALARLDRLQDAAFHRLGSSEAELFRLCADAIEPKVRSGGFAQGVVVSLEDALADLDRQSTGALGEVGILRHFDSAQDMQRWIVKTHAVLAEVAALVRWIASRLAEQPDAVPVPLLRDTLLVHFGLEWLRRDGAPIQPSKPLFVGRRFVRETTGDESAYLTLSSDVLYGVLQAGCADDLGRLRREFAKETRARSASLAPLAAASRAQLDSLRLEGRPVFLETGLHGTFPLWLASVARGDADFLMYTTLPWLRTAYRDVIFRPHSHGLRDLETLMIHDHLMQLESSAPGSLRVRLTTDALARDLAVHELQLFRKILKGPVDA